MRLVVLVALALGLAACGQGNLERACEIGFEAARMNDAAAFSLHPEQTGPRSVRMRVDELSPGRPHARYLVYCEFSEETEANQNSMLRRDRAPVMVGLTVNGTDFNELVGVANDKIARYRWE